VGVGVSLASASPGSGARVWGAPAGMLRFSKVAQAPAGGVITLFSKNAKETDVDEPPSGFSQGDEMTVSSPLFDTAGNRVGHLDVHGAVTAVLPTHTARGQFEFTATRRGGAITATGVATFSDQSQGFVAAVTGGTGAYQTTDGWVRVTFLTPTTTRLVYHLTD